MGHSWRAIARQESWPGGPGLVAWALSPERNSPGNSEHATPHYNRVMRRLLPFALLAFAALNVHAGLPFLENDFPQALSLAQAKNVPIFIEAWAPW